MERACHALGPWKSTMASRLGASSVWPHSPVAGRTPDTRRPVGDVSYKRGMMQIEWDGRMWLSLVFYSESFFDSGISHFLG